MKFVPIKIGQQEQANKPIFLLPNGNIICGNFTYKRRFVEQFKKNYQIIFDLIPRKSKTSFLDVSEYRYWDAISIYDYLVHKWQRGISVRKVEQFANETEITKVVTSMIPEFRRAVDRRWLRIFRSSNPIERDTLKEAWQIL